MRYLIVGKTKDSNRYDQRINYSNVHRAIFGINNDGSINNVSVAISCFEMAKKDFPDITFKIKKII